MVVRRKQACMQAQGLGYLFLLDALLDVFCLGGDAMEHAYAGVSYLMANVRLAPGGATMTGDSELTLGFLARLRLCSTTAGSIKQATIRACVTLHQDSLNSYLPSRPSKQSSLRLFFYKVT